jgi:hypothetical protein
MLCSSRGPFHPSPKGNAPAVHIPLDYSDSQIPSCEDYLYKDPDSSMEHYASSF